MTINRLRLEFATAGFLNEMRKQHTRTRPPDVPCPVKNFSDYEPGDRSLLMAAIERAIQYADPSADKAFDAWLQKREERQTSETRSTSV